MPTTDKPNGYRGAQDIFSAAGEYNAMLFQIQSVLAGRNQSALVQIVAVTNAGGLSPVGFVDVLPLVNQVDGNGNMMPHEVVHNLPYFRIQGGSDAIIIDPKIGDIGCAVFADRDISAAKKTKKQSNPGSHRRADMADGMYFGGFLNGVPAQYIQFAAGGISIVSPNAVTITAPAINTSGTWTHTGSIINNGKHIDSTHNHGGVSPGGSNTAAPN